MIEVQIKNKKAARITVVCLLLSLIGLSAFLGVRLVKWKDYVPVEAAVQAIDTSEGTLNHPNDRYTEVTYTFRLNGQEYRAARNERFQSQSRVGEVRRIRCNPENPEMLEDVWSRSGIIIILCGGTGFLVLLLVGLWQEEKSSYRRQKEKTGHGCRKKYF